MSSVGSSPAPPSGDSGDSEKKSKKGRGGGRDPAAKRTSKPSAAGTPAEKEEHPDEAESLWAGYRHILSAVPSWLASMFMHMILLLVLALITIPSPPNQLFNELMLGQGDPQETPELQDLAEEDIQPDVEATDVSEFVPEMDVEVITKEPDISLEDDVDPAKLQIAIDPIGELSAGPQGATTEIGALDGSGFEGRSAASRAALVRSGGGTEASEGAVGRALKWFASHQNEDGSWNLDHRFGPCQNRCSNPGSGSNALNGATALGLLPFLGAGHTHREGNFKPTVKKGLDFLMKNMKVFQNRGSLFDEDGTMYSHGLGAIVLCEAYAMTNDNRIGKAAQLAIYETAYTQDPVGGGWRYRPHERGDTSALGWQVMALKSAHMAYLTVPEQTYRKAKLFLDSVQTEEGARYGYLDPGKGTGTSAVGLLCRMYLGWKRDNPALERGVAWMSKRGPSQNNMYYNYYATQVMRHYGGEEWETWNPVMRDYLVRTQATQGHEEGSWFFPRGGHSGDVGGRLYTTSMATMILEVYYRHLPLYKQQAAEEDFPL